MGADKGSNVIDHFIKEVEKSNSKRVNMVQVNSRRGYKVSALAASFALFGYFYSMYTIRADRHLDKAFDELPDPAPKK